MTIAQDIINGKLPNFNFYLQQGELLDDIDEYGFTPLIQSVITRQITITAELLSRGVNINKVDITGRTPLHWAVDNNDFDMSTLLVNNGANVNAYTAAGLSVLVYPVLRGHNNLKHLLYQHGAKLDFALDFINAKLIGHRYDLAGDIDVVNAENTFIEIDFEGFMLEFSVAVIKDSLRRFISSYASRHLRHHFSYLYLIMDAFDIASELLQFQHRPKLSQQDLSRLQILMSMPLLILPAASRGHAMCFIRYQQWWAKIDRGENSLKEGSINIYEITLPKEFNIQFLQQFLFQKQERRFFHEKINQLLGLKPVAKIPIQSQIVGNCSWANIQAGVLTAYALQQGHDFQIFNAKTALDMNQHWLVWDRDRALDECIQRFYIANNARRASIAAILGTILFQACDAGNPHHMVWAEKILTILTLPDYYYILASYLEIYCVRRLTRQGNNLLKLLDDCGINPNIGVTPVATGLKSRDKE